MNKGQDGPSIIYLKKLPQGTNTLRAILNLAKLMFGPNLNYSYIPTDAKPEDLNRRINELNEIPKDVNGELSIKEIPDNKQYLIYWLELAQQNRPYFFVECPSGQLNEEDIDWLKGKMLSISPSSKIVIYGQNPTLWADIVDQFVDQGEDYNYLFQENHFKKKSAIAA